ncbi:FCD domain-containing protein [Ruminococcaceae bacterium OttesenSCG-928-D13]|nr:FCD domain-containing protein [Ruminococcaceae bacterium OttesenSCG-928-D13]
MRHHLLGLVASHQPVGCTTLQLELEKMGLRVSSATVGRTLKQLDHVGLTERDSNRGRRLTGAGASALAQLDRMSTGEALHRNLQASVRANYGDLIQVYRVRRALETLSVRQAIENEPTRHQLDRIRQTITSYRHQLRESANFIDPALDFHVRIAECADNRFLEAMLKMLVFEQKCIEDGFENLVTRDYGTRYSGEHEDIFKAMLAKDARRAALLMGKHFDTIIGQLRQEWRLEQEGKQT